MPGPLPDQHAKILAQKLADRQLALFVGAGVSRQAMPKDGSGRRLPLWNEMAEQVAAACHEDLETYGGNILDLFDAIELGQSRFTLEEAVRSALDDEAYDPSAVHDRCKWEHGLANCSYSLGDVCLIGRDYSRAEAQYQGALGCYERLSDVLGRANCSMGLADINRENKDMKAYRLEKARVDALLRKYFSVERARPSIIRQGPLSKRWRW